MAPPPPETGYRDASWNARLRSALFHLAVKMRERLLHRRTTTLRTETKQPMLDSRDKPTASRMPTERGSDSRKKASMIEESRTVTVPILEVTAEHGDRTQILLRCPLTQLFSDEEEPGFGLVNLKHEVVIRKTLENLGQEGIEAFALETLELSFPDDDLDGACSIHPYCDRLSQFASIMCGAGQKVITLRVAPRLGPYQPSEDVEMYDSM